MYISVHIPKTAGTTIGYILDFGCKRRIFYDYTEYNYIENQAVLDDDINFLEANKHFIDKKFDVIHGHFYADKYLPIFPDAKYLVCLRDPVSRTLSQYFHILEEGSGSHWTYDRLVSDEMDIVDLAMRPGTRYAQKRHLGGIELKDYAHIFITEHLAESIYKFQLNHSFERRDPYMNFEGEASIPNTNPRSARKVVHKNISQAQLDKLKIVLKEENEIYAKAIELFKKQ